MGAGVVTGVVALPVSDNLAAPVAVGVCWRGVARVTCEVETTLLGVPVVGSVGAELAQGNLAVPEEFATD
jgi:hypothetical protein